MLHQTSHRTLLFHIKRAWEQINYQLFDQQLKSPSFELLTGGGVLGSWRASARVISLQETMLYTSPWLEVLEVLKHEMAHQYISEILGTEGESAHGPQFQEVCAARHIDARSGGSVTYDPAVKKLLSKINKLLALAESDNSYEAEQAAQRAQELLIKHHIRLGQDPSYAEPIDDNLHTSIMGFRQLGVPKSRRYQYEYGIANLLSDHFFVSAIWVGAYSVKEDRQGKVLEVCGRYEDLEIASYVHDFILNHLKLAWDVYRKNTQAKGLKKKLSFSLGLVQGFADKLNRHKNTHSEDTKDLIYLGKSATEAFLANRYPKISRRRSSTWTPTRDYHQGYEEGHTLHLRHGVKSEGSHRAVRLEISLEK